MTKERGLLLDAEMVRAVLDGKKTQTRMPVKQDIPKTSIIKPFRNMHTQDLRWCAVDKERPHISPVHDGTTFACPFGKVGDRLYVRETFAAYAPAYGKEVMGRKTNGFDNMGYEWDKWVDDFEDKQGDSYEVAVMYRASGKQPWHGGWIPSVRMPKQLSRIWLEITDIRAEKIWNMKEADAKAEGVEPFDFGDTGSYYESWKRSWQYRDSLHEVWNDRYDKKGYGYNDKTWVWVAEFKVKTK